MLTEICASLRNWFLVPNGVHLGTYIISGGSIAPLNFLQEGQYYRIIGSVFNDGIYKYSSSSAELIDETFHGAVWALAIPPDLIELAEEIKKYNDGDGKTTPFVSESIGGWSGTRATDSSGVPITWNKAFASRLNRWRKI